MNMKLFIFGVFLAQAAYSQSILNCGAPASGLKRCSFNSLPAFSATIEGEAYEAIYTINLNGSCPGSNFKLPIKFQVGEALGNPENVYLNKPGQEFIAEGKGALTLVDPNPTYTANFRFPQNCDISVGSISPRPNTNALNLWVASATSTTKRLNLAANAWFRKGEFMLYYDAYISSEDNADVGAVLSEIAATLDSEDPLLAVITSIQNSAPRAEIEAHWNGIQTRIQNLIADGERDQRKLVFALGQENAELATAIKSGKAALAQ